MALVYSYIRFSSKQQADGDSLRRQMDLGQQWVERHGHTMANMVLHDLGVSALRGKNAEDGALGRFLDEVRAGTVKPGSILLVEALDRLSRAGVSKAHTLFLQILEAGIDIVCLIPYEMRFTRDSVNDLVGLLIPLIAFHLGHVESLQKSQRISAHWDNVRTRVSKGEFVGRKIPGWVTWNEEQHKFEENEHAETVRLMVDKLLASWGIGKLMRWLNAERKPMGLKPYWSWTHLRRFLGQRTILGERQQYKRTEKGRVPVGKPVEGYYPALIDEPTWYRLQNALAKNKTTKCKSDEFVNLFTGIISNGFDGHSMVMVGSKTRRKTKDAYRDRALVSLGAHTHVKGSHNVAANYYHVEDAVLRHVRGLDAGVLQQDNGKANLLTQKEETFAGLEARLATITAAMHTAKLEDVPALVELTGKLSRKRDVLLGDIERLRQELSANDSVEQVKEVTDLLADAQGEDLIKLRLRLRARLKDIVEKIVVYPDSYKRRRQGMLHVVLRNGVSHFLAYGKDVGGNCQILCDKGVVDEVAGEIDVFLKKLRQQVDSLDVVPPDDKLPDTLTQLVDCYFTELKHGPHVKQRFSRKAYARKMVNVVGDMPAREFAPRH